MDDPGVDRYRATTRLGGSRAVVRLATDRRTGRAVVLKTAPWERPEVTAALAREAAILGRVAHPSLVELLDVVDHLDGRTLVLANASAGDLTRLLATRGALDAVTAADLGGRLAGALAALHDVGVVHRDVRPSNVVLDAELVPRLCDLDHALDPSQPALPSDRSVVGDAAHVDPRLFDGLPQGPSMDLFGLGSVVWAAVSGGLPRPTDLRDAVGTVPTPLLTTIAACLDSSIGDARAAAAAFAAAAVEVRGWRRALPVDPASASADDRRDRARATADEGGRRSASPRSVRDALPADGRAGSGDGGREAPSARGRPRDTAGAGRTPAGAGQWAWWPRRAHARPGAPSPDVGRPRPAERARVAALAGGGAGSTRPTRRWAPPHAPGAMATGPHAPPPRRRRVAVAAVAAAAFAVVAIAGWATTTRRGADAAQVAAEAPAGTSGSTTTPSRPPLCEGQPVTAADRDAEVAVADLRGDGCGVVISFDGTTLSTPDARYRVGQPGDRLLVGDWDGDGRWSPGIHRPATGEVFLFEDVPSPAGVLVSRPALRFPPATDVVVVAGASRGHDVTLARPQP